MVDSASPPTPPDPLPSPTTFDIGALRSQTEVINQASQSISGMQAITEGLGSTFNNLANTLNASMVSFQGVGAVTSEQIRQFSALTAAAIGTGQAFSGVADAVNFNPIKAQFDSVIGSITDTKTLIGTASAALGSAFDANIVKGLGLEAAKKAVQDFAGQMLQGADNGLKFQSIFLGLSAQTGQLGNVMNVAGKDFKDINSVLMAQATIISDSIDATGRAPEEVEKWYVSLGKIPGALNATVASSENSTESVSMLTAAMRVASGTGRSLESITTDLTTAFNNYGLEGEDALRFTTRMSELSNKFNVQFSDMQKGINDVAIAFKGMADAGAASNKMAESAAAIFNNYIGALKQTGMTGAEATANIAGMVQEVKKLDLAQKAFLSGQTGGAGGLMGAFQIEKMLQDGNLEGVFDKAMEQVKGQVGNIVTLEEAGSSQAAAEQLTQQIQILKQGPLGQFAKTDTDAIRILEGLKKKEEGGDITELSQDIVQQTMETGVEYDKKSYTELAAIRGILQRGRSIASMGALDLVQGSFTAGTGNSELEGNKQLDMRLRAAARTGGANQAEYLAGMTNQDLRSINKIGQTSINTNLESMFKVKEGLSATTSNFISTLQKTFLQEKPGMSVEDQKKMYRDQIKFRREKAEALPQDQRKKELEKIEKDEAVGIAAANYAQIARDRLKSAGALGEMAPPPGPEQLSGAAEKVTRQKSPAEEGRAAVVGRTESSHTASVDLHVKAICKHCENELESQQVGSTSPGAKLKK